MLDELAPLFIEQEEEENRIREKLTKAQQAGDEERFRKLRGELKQAGKSVNDRISEIAYIHLGEKVDATELLAALGMSEVSSGMINSMEKGSVVTSLPKLAKPEPPEELDRSERKKWAHQAKSDYGVYQKLVSGMARASELESPARRGHFLRDFGQSDREVIENAADNASVPQALNLLNGPMVQALTNKYAVFGKRVHAAGTPEG